MTGPSSAKSVAVLGGGTAGWMTAASLIHRLGPLGVTVTVIESSQIGTIGVGEATVPAILRYFQSLDLDVYEVLRATNGTVKLGIEFEGWKHEGHTFMHPFGRYGIQAGPVAFHHLWNRLKACGDAHPIDEYSLGVQLARKGRVLLPKQDPRADFEVFDWAVHFDAGRFAHFLRAFSEQRGVHRIDARLKEALRGETGSITGLKLETDETVVADLYIDCSGFHRLLIERTLQSGYVDWQHWLPCDRAVALPCSAQAPMHLPPFTRSRAVEAGWCWRIPLQHRVGNGYVYSSAHCTDDAALALLRGQLEGEPLAEPNLVRFRTGHVKRFWIANCVAIGLAGGFLEPLESTSISLIQMGIDKLIYLWPEAQAPQAFAAEYNRLSVQEFERVRDFIVLHYAANGRSDGELWRYCRDMSLPESLAHKMEMYRSGGRIVQFQSESFFDASWVCMYSNLGIEARTWDPLAELVKLEDLKRLAGHMRPDISALAEQGMTHGDFLRSKGALASP
jgi:tryptophan halogenase